jgi:hypothetical protein
LFLIFFLFSPFTFLKIKGKEGLVKDLRICKIIEAANQYRWIIQVFEMCPQLGNIHKKGRDGGGIKD